MLMTEHTDATPVLLESDFEQWYQSIYPRVYAAIVIVAASPDDARDAIQDALVKALEDWERVKAMDSPEAWLYSVARNKVRRTQRRRNMLRKILLRENPSHFEMAHPLYEYELWTAVKNLPERQRTAVALRHIAHLTEPEVAQIMGITRGTVSSTLRAAHSRLKLQLDETTTEELEVNDE